MGLLSSNSTTPRSARGPTLPARWATIEINARGSIISRNFFRLLRAESRLIIAQQTAGLVDHSKGTIAAMDRLKADAIAMKNALLVGDVDEMARILDDSWAAKKLRGCPAPC